MGCNQFVRISLSLIQSPISIKHAYQILTEQRGRERERERERDKFNPQPFTGNII
jgi:hypothetical protein